MVRTVIITRPAQKQLNKLDKIVQVRILDKLTYFASTLNPQIYAEVLMDFDHGTYRYRI
jgi:mRNA-degrading endonuclease RelE of RelBE toxin-antitoxin system